MPEVEITLPWRDDLEPVSTRELMFLSSADGHIASQNNTPADGPITDDEVAAIIATDLDTEDTYGGRSDARAAVLSVKDWRATLDSGLLPIYEFHYSQLGSVSHVHDWDPTDWRVAKTLELRTQWADTLGVHIDNVLVDWEIPTFFSEVYGTYSGRQVEVIHNRLLGEAYDRDGFVIDSGLPTPDLNVGLISVASPGDWGASAVTTGLEGPLFVLPHSWTSTVLEARAGDDSYTDAQLVLESLSPPVPTGGTTLLDVDDAWFEANAWPTKVDKVADDYMSRGFPVRIDYESGGGGGGHTRFESAAEVWFKSTWTPPRYRIRYFTETSVIPPRRIFQRSDGATHGARRVLGGGNTVQAGNRAIGGIL